MVWRATLPEVHLAIEARLGRARGLPPDAAALAALMAAFPDQPAEGDPDDR